MNIAIGPAFVYRRDSAGKQYVLDFPQALEKAKEQLACLAADNEIFAAHYEIADDPMLSDTVEEYLSAGMSLEDAVNSTSSQLAQMFASIDDEYLRARVDDVRDVCARILSVASSSAPSRAFDHLPDRAVIVASELFPSDTVQMDFERIAAFVTEKGSRTSHVCIIAATHGIPVLTGVKGCMEAAEDGAMVIVDQLRTLFIPNPSEEMLKTYTSRLAQEQSDRQAASAGAFSASCTKSGKLIEVMANAGSVEEVRQAMENGADGIGLFRTEFLYMQSHEAFPSEDEQFAAYSQAAAFCGGKPFVIRTLDIGGDKQLEYYEFPKEDNPFLGCRAIRFCLAHIDIFKTQLRAVLRVAAIAGNDVRIMFPMIAKLDELTKAKALLEQCRRELADEGLNVAPTVKCGIMVETPAAVLMAGRFAQHCDFFSIGTNDLTQYVLAADRGNPDVSYLYDCSDPAVVEAVRMVCEAASANGIPAGMCGQIASDSSMTQLLLSAGLTELSVSAPSVSEVKMAVRNCP